MSSRRRFVRTPSPGPSWATLPSEHQVVTTIRSELTLREDNPTSSTVSSDEESSPVTTASYKATRKRKNSPKPNMHQRKKPKMTHSARPVSATKHVPGSSNRKHSQGRSSESPDFDGMESIINSSQGVSSAPASSSKSMASTTKGKAVGGIRRGTKQTCVLTRTSSTDDRCNVCNFVSLLIIVG
jgi:hypothetical protein